MLPRRLTHTHPASNRPNGLITTPLNRDFFVMKNTQKKAGNLREVFH
jgi:hypothetical protein